MAVVTVRLKGLAWATRRYIKDLQVRSKREAWKSARSAMKKAIKLTEEAGLVDTGFYRSSFAISPTRDGARMGNSAPYADTIEIGRAPGATPPPQAAIEAWVRSKLGFQAAEAGALTAIVRQIVMNIHFQGQPPHHIIERAFRRERERYELRVLTMARRAP